MVTRDFVELTIAFVATFGLLWGILTSTKSEALKYFAVNIVLLVIVVLYILFDLRKRIDTLEENSDDS